MKMNYPPNTDKHSRDHRAGPQCAHTGARISGFRRILPVPPAGLHMFNIDFTWSDFYFI